MKRSALLALPRLLLAAGLGWWFFSHRADAETRAGQMSIAGLFDDIVAPLIVILIVAVGSWAQILLRKKPIRYTVLADVALLVLIFVGLACLLVSL